MMLRAVSRCLAATALVGLLVAGAARAEDVTVQIYSYNREPPYATGPAAGLTFDLADYLNRKAAGKAKFSVRLLPRARLDLVMAKDFKGVVAWVFPPWFKDAERTRYLWSEPILADENLILSRADKPVEYAGPESLRSVRLGGVLGYRYLGIDDLVKNGEIKRSDARSEEASLLKLFAGRVDAALLPRSSAGFWLGQMGKEQAVHIAPRAHSSYTRHFLIAPAQPELKPLLDAIIAGMPNDPAWRQTLAKYRIGR